MEKEASLPKGGLKSIIFQPGRRNYLVIVKDKKAADICSKM